MGRQGAAGLLPLLIAALLAACRPSPAQVDPSARFSADGTARTRQLGIYAGVERVGDLSASRREGRWGDGPAVELTEEVALRLSFRGDAFTVASRQSSWIDPRDMGLLGSASTVDFGAGSWETRWQRSADGSYARSESLAGRVRTEQVRLPAGTLASDALPLVLDDLAAAGETRRSVQAHNLVLGRAIPVEIRFLGREGEALRFTVSMWGLEEEVWVGPDGLPVRETLSLARLEARPADGVEAVGNLPLERVLAQTSVLARGVPKDLGARPRAVLALDGLSEAPPETPWQRVSRSGDRFLVELTTPRPAAPPTASAPSPPAPALDGFGLDLDSPRIRALAAEVTAGRSGAWEKASAVARHVHDRLGKSMRECFSALQVLEVGEGECQSHSLLTVALCRAAGVPSRFAYGVVYLPDRGGFLFHTWVEVLDGAWIPLDPTLGSIPAGPDHLTLAVGGYRDQFQMFPFILGRSGWSVTFVE